MAGSAPAGGLAFEQRGGGGWHGIGQRLPVAAQAGQPLGVDGGAGGAGVQAVLGAVAQHEDGDKRDEKQPAEGGDERIAAEGAHGDDGEGGKEEEEVDVAQAAAARVELRVIGFVARQAGGVGGGGVGRLLFHAHSIHWHGAMAGLAQSAGACRQVGGERWGQRRGSDRLRLGAHRQCLLQSGTAWLRDQ